MSRVDILCKISQKQRIQSVVTKSFTDPGPVSLHGIWRLLLWRSFRVGRLLPAVTDNTRIQSRVENSKWNHVISSKRIIPDTSRGWLHAACAENSSDPHLSFFPSSEGRFRGGGGGGWRWRGSGGRGAFGSRGSFLNEKTPLSWSESLHNATVIRQCSGCADPNLGAGGWRWRGRGAIGAFGSGGAFLMWKCVFVWVSIEIVSALNSLKHAPKHAWPLFLYFQWRSLGRRRNKRTRMSGGRVLAVLPEQMPQEHKSERCNSGVPEAVRAQRRKAKSWPVTACTECSRQPARPCVWVCNWRNRSQCM